MGSATSSRAAWSALAVLTAMNLLNYIDRYILAAVIKPVSEELNLSHTEGGLLAAAFLVSYTVFSPLVCLLETRLARRRVLALGVGVWSLATAGTGLAHSFGQAVLARAVMGVGEAAYAVLAPALISDLFPRAKRNKAMTVFYLAIPVGAALGYAIGAGMNAWQGWRSAFFVVGLPGLAVALAALALREPPPGAAEEVSEEDRRRHEAVPLGWRDYLGLARNRSFLFNSLGMAMFTFALGGLQYWTPYFLADARGMDNDRASFLLGAVVLASSLVGTPAGGALADWVANRVRGGYFWTCGVSMLLAAPLILAALLAREPVLIFGLIFLGLVLALMQYGPSNAVLVNVTVPRLRAAAVATNILLIHALGDIPSPALIGAMSDLTGKNLFWGMLLTVPAMIASGVLFCLGAPHLEADQEAVTAEIRSGA